MTRSETLKKAIQKAIDNGFNAEIKDGWVIHKNLHAKIENTISYDVIFNHDFAKALWGEGATYDMTHIKQPDNSFKMNVRPMWQYHIQQMVISDDPIEYLGENI